MTNDELGRGADQREHGIRGGIRQALRGGQADLRVGEIREPLGLLLAALVHAVFLEQFVVEPALVFLEHAVDGLLL
jgi:hypothetical protein